ncbi:dicarboxylate/amino acid:cation symporter [Plectonema cf. radiosum LEGE 06105]|uniref:Dicarboxylate/amino acid:cation symporter n=1 Tax=Plectonema cf. radiosum LEGE 06105 TaxID=945769 RepID=A0A8J7F713_9CYAN|nr:dicarboxylate/amino acid:cation symporter [Plectonema radiosum]MBE9216002.1 dicarboxylate/amino acid:cation symporter [Plectonema cf. radiosum LEGE 06105]
MNQTEKPASSQKGIPFSLQIVIAVVLALIVGILLGAGNPNPEFKSLITNLEIPTNLVFKALTALAAPLVLLVLLDTLISKEISGREGRNLVVFILQNATVGILIGFLVVSILSPGTWVNLNQTQSIGISHEKQDLWNIIREFLDSLTPEALLKPLVENNFISLVLIALGFGFVLRGIKLEQQSQSKRSFQSLEKIIKTLSEAIQRILKWVIALLPIAVFGVVAKTVSEQGFKPFISFGALIIAVLLALFLQACYYLVRIKFGSWVNPFDFLRQGSEALLFAFVTASSMLTMPTAYQVLVSKIGLREKNASLGIYLGANISKDAVPIFQVMFTLFVSQILGQSFSPAQYLILFLLSFFCSISTAGIPGSAIVMMILVFNTVFTNSELAISYIALLLSIYWFLDMCGTAINVMGHMTLAILLEGKKQSDESTI